MIESHHFVVGSPKYSRRKSNNFHLNNLKPSLWLILEQDWKRWLYTKISFLSAMGVTGTSKSFDKSALVFTHFASSIQSKLHSIHSSYLIDTA